MIHFDPSLKLCGRRHWGGVGDRGGASDILRHFLEQKIFFLRKIGVESREGEDEKSDENDTERRSCRQKRDVSHTNFLCTFSVTFSIILQRATKKAHSASVITI